MKEISWNSLLDINDYRCYFADYLQVCLQIESRLMYYAYNPVKVFSVKSCA